MQSASGQAAIERLTVGQRLRDEMNGEMQECG